MGNVFILIFIVNVMKKVFVFVLLLIIVSSFVLADVIFPTETTVYFTSGGEPYEGEVSATVNCWGYVYEPGPPVAEPPVGYTPEIAFTFSFDCEEYSCVHTNPYYLNYRYLEYCNLVGEVDGREFLIENYSNSPVDFDTCVDTGEQESPLYAWRSCEITFEIPEGGVDCIEEWVCDNCMGECVDVSDCGTENGKPTATQNCVLVEPHKEGEGTSVTQTQKISVEQTQTVTGEKGEVIAVQRSRIEGMEISVVGNKITVGKYEVISLNMPIIEDAGKVYIEHGGERREMLITPENAAIKTRIRSVEKIMIEEHEGQAAYSVYGEDRAMLFWLLPMTAKVKGVVNLEGDLIDTETPWWSFLAAGV